MQNLYPNSELSGEKYVWWMSRILLGIFLALSGVLSGMVFLGINVPFMGWFLFFLLVGTGFCAYVVVPEIDWARCESVLNNIAEFLVTQWPASLAIGFGAVVAGALALDTFFRNMNNRPLGILCLGIFLFSLVVASVSFYGVYEGKIKPWAESMDKKIDQWQQKTST